MTSEPIISMRIHSASENLILAACDKELLGRTLSHGDIQFKVSEHFYGGDLVNDDTFLSMISQVRSANIVGNHCVDLLKKKGILDDGSIILIQGIKHSQLYDLSDLG